MGEKPKEIVDDFSLSSLVSYLVLKCENYVTNS